MADEDVWKPGSFTKNFSWGSKDNGLVQLYNSIQVGFGGVVSDVSRKVFRERVEQLNRPDFIPINFFLFNKKGDGFDNIISDELVFQAIMGDHTARFDKLALFAFNFSYVGRWKGARPNQRRPALWAFHYIRDRVSSTMSWNTAGVSVDDIEHFVIGDTRYSAETARKLASNLNHLYSAGGLSEFGQKKVDRWWADALFLALDRLIEDRLLDGIHTPPADYAAILSNSGFHAISGKSSIEKSLAEKHLIRLYTMCGGRERFSVEQTLQRVDAEIPVDAREIPNSIFPYGVVHPTNPNILKNIPPTCVPLARAAGFDIVRAMDLEDFGADEYIKEKTREAAERMLAENTSPIMSAEELEKLTRE
ncbi:hypothetical protein [Azospirillum largimobile]